MEGKQYKAHLMYTWGDESWEYSFVLSEGFKNVDIIIFFFILGLLQIIQMYVNYKIQVRLRLRLRYYVVIWELESYQDQSNISSIGWGL